MIVVTLTSAIGYGTPRFRHAAEVSIVLLAGVALSAGAGARAPARPRDAMAMPL